MRRTMRSKYTLGIDYGTQSGRTVLVEVSTGREAATAVHAYPHGVMDEVLPDGRTKLPPDWALQHPQDYLEVLSETIPEVLKESGVSPEDVIGLGIDFTACTMLPVDTAGTPLCFDPTLAGRPHAYVKLWKHHAAQEEANKLNEVAEARGEAFLQRFGGRISSEWLFPKIWQILNEAPEIYERADQFMEAGDWVIRMLTGSEKRSNCLAGYKALWHKREGYPAKEFFKALDPRMELVVTEKLSTDIYPIGTKAGELTPQAAALTGLKAGTAVAVANVDAHVSMAPVGITEPGTMLLILGTSACHLLLGEEERMVSGICGVVEDGIIPGYFGYEAGQCCVGDHFEWFVEHGVPVAYRDEAQEKGVSIHDLLSQKAQLQAPGESGLLVLDWWNGNRSILVDADLTGLILGCTLRTRPEEIYRALIEATAYGTRRIIENFDANGIPIHGLYAAGGIAEKNPFLMQVYADVTGREIQMAASSQIPALGSAMFGAVVAGQDRGGYDTIVDAAKAMAKVQEKCYTPIPAHTAVYDKLYAEYKVLHDYFGRGGNDVMKRLKRIKKAAAQQ